VKYEHVISTPQVNLSSVIQPHVSQTLHKGSSARPDTASLMKGEGTYVTPMALMVRRIMRIVSVLPRIDACCVRVAMSSAAVDGRSWAELSGSGPSSSPVRVVS
jgi:hypothetical protein